MNDKSKKINILMILGIPVLVFINYYFFPVQETKCYSWIVGVWDGFFAAPNYILSLIFDGFYAKAPLHTEAYNVFWWIFMLFSTVTCYIAYPIRAIRSIRRLTRLTK